MAMQEGSAYGATLLAMVGTGEYQTVPEVCAAVLEETSLKNPEPEPAAYYERAYRVYTSLYPALRQSFRAIQELDG